MKKLLILIAFVSSSGFAQKITLVRTFGSSRYEMDTLTLSSRQVLSILKDNPVAYDEFRKARVNETFAGLAGLGGGVLVAIPVVTAIAGGTPEWKLAIAGGALIVLGIPLNRAHFRHAQNALDEYNKKFTSRLDPHLYLSPAGARLIIRF
jgi:hypothetical protein